MILQMSEFSNESFGRFGNQLFKYYFMRRVARDTGCELRLPGWLGDLAFSLPRQSPPGPANEVLILQASEPRLEDPDGDLAAVKAGLAAVSCVELHGFFQYHTAFHAPDRDFLRSLFPPNPLIDEQLRSRLSAKIGVRDFICVHLRRGDYLNYSHSPLFWPTEPASVVAALKSLAKTGMHEAPIYLSSDDLEGGLAALHAAGIEAFSSRDLFQYPDPSLALIIDFLVMCRASVLMISNSSLSFFASLLNSHARVFLRPCPDTGVMLPFDPWNSRPLLSRGEPRSAGQ